MPRKKGEYVSLPKIGKVWTIRQYARAHGKNEQRAANLTKMIMERLGKLYGRVYDTKPGQAGYPSKNFVPIGTPWCFGEGWKIEKQKTA